MFSLNNGRVNIFFQKYLGKCLWWSFLLIQSKSTIILLGVPYMKSLFEISKSFETSKSPILKIIDSVFWQHYNFNFKGKLFNNLPMIHFYINDSFIIPLATHNNLSFKVQLAINRRKNLRLGKNVKNWRILLIKFSTICCSFQFWVSMKCAVLSLVI